MNNKCYKCDKELKPNEEFWHPIIEDVSDAENPPEACFCEEHYKEIAEPDY